MKAFALVVLAACSAPSTPAPTVTNATPPPARCATLAIHVAEEMSAYMDKVEAALTRPARVRIETDEWGHQSRPLGGSLRFDHRLVAAARTEIESVLRDLERADPSIALPADRMLAYEQRAGEWWSYYVERTPTVAHADVAKAEAAGDRVILTLTEPAARTLEDQTGKNVERKLAVMLDGVVIVAPVIPGIITTGRLEIPVADAAAIAARLACPQGG